jgi:hypothetical protein
VGTDSYEHETPRPISDLYSAFTNGLVFSGANLSNSARPINFYSIWTILKKVVNNLSSGILCILSFLLSVSLFSPQWQTYSTGTAQST